MGGGTVKTPEQERRWGVKVEDKTREELIEQIRRLQDSLAGEGAGRQAKEAALLKRCADFRKAARIANKRADEAEAALKAVHKAINPVRAILKEQDDVRS